MQNIENRVLDFIALATPVNGNAARCNCSAQFADEGAVEHLLVTLEKIKVVGKTYERPPLNRGNIILHPAPWLRRQLKSNSL